MHTQDLSKFIMLVQEHKSANHILFETLEEEAVQGTLTAEMYNLFAVNIAARTMMSLSEIHACCIQASLDLNPLRTAYSVMTGAEEGGFGNPKEVHTILMMNALNTHGRIVYNLDPIDLNHIMALMRIFYYLSKIKSLYVAEKIYPGILDYFVNSELNNINTLLTTVQIVSNQNSLDFSINSEININEIDQLLTNIIHRLHMLNIIDETIEYSFAQFKLLENILPGYIQGVGFAHEGLADGMINNIFKIIFSQIERYPSKTEFINYVYPYFSAHGNYLETYWGWHSDSEGIEKTHAQRELDKLAELSFVELKFAWEGAIDFSNRNVKIWDGIFEKIKSNRREVLKNNYEWENSFYKL